MNQKTCQGALARQWRRVVRKRRLERVKCPRSGAEGLVLVDLALDMMGALPLKVASMQRERLRRPGPC